LKAEVQKHEDELERLEEVFAEGKTTAFCGIAFVSFNTEHDKNAVLEAHKISGKKRILK